MEDYLLVGGTGKHYYKSKPFHQFHHYKKYTQIMTIKSTKIVAAAVGFTMALGLFAAVGVASTKAATVDASTLINLLVAAGVIPADKAAAALAAVGGTATAMSSTTFSKDLTVGSSGADVTALQNAIGVSPATGYFGSITKAAVVAYQKAHGISGTGYVGPLTRASLNSSTVASTPSTTTTTTTTVTTPVVNSGVEGTLTVDKASISNSTVYEGDTMHAVLGLKAQAKLSDVNIQRIKLDLGASTSFYTKVFKTMYLTDDSGKILAQADLNSNTVVKDNGEYYLTLGGFSYTVPKDSTKYLWVKVDAYSSIKSEDYGNPRTIALASNNPVRGVDGAGIDQYAGGSSVTQNVTISSSLTDSASLDVSVNSANFKPADVVASNGADNDEYDQLPLLAFDLRANKGDMKVTDIYVGVTGSVSHATTTTVYLYDGSTLIQSESVNTSGDNAGKAYFSDIDNLIVGKDQVKTLTVKADVRNADATATNIKATVTKVLAENLSGTEASNSSALASLSVAGENMSVRNVGPVFTLASKKITSSVTQDDGNGAATSTVTATYVVNVTAVGDAITFGYAASSTPSFATSSAALAIYRNGALVSDNTVVNGLLSLKPALIKPTGTIDATGGFTIPKGSTASIEVVYQFKAGNAYMPGTYQVGINQIAWDSSTVAGTSSFMSGQSDWFTGIVNTPANESN